jgi:hypothetical protein
MDTAMGFKTVLGILLVISLSIIAVMGLYGRNHKTILKLMQTTSAIGDMIGKSTDRLLHANVLVAKIVTSKNKQDIDSLNLSNPSGLDDPKGLGVYYIMTDNSFGCTTKELLDKLLKLQASCKTKKYDKLMGDAITNGEVTNFRTHEGVYLQETDPATGVVRINRITEKQSYWTVSKTIQ